MFSTLPLLHATSMECLMALSTLLGVVLNFGNGRIKLLGDAVDYVIILHHHLDGFPQEMVTLYMGRNADGKKNIGNPLLQAFSVFILVTGGTTLPELWAEDPDNSRIRLSMTSKSKGLTI